MNQRRLNSHVYFCIVFALLSFCLLPMIASLVTVISGYAALREISQRPDFFYGRQLAQWCIYAAYVSATLWLCVILSYVFLQWSGISFSMFIGLA